MTERLTLRLTTLLCEGAMCHGNARTALAKGQQLTAMSPFVSSARLIAPLPAAPPSSPAQLSSVPVALPLRSPAPARSTPRRVVVTGLGAVTPLGLGVATSWAALLRSETGVRALAPEDLPPSHRPLLPGLPCRVVALLPRAQVGVRVPLWFRSGKDGDRCAVAAGY
jgi:hypothetical protein